MEAIRTYHTPTGPILTIVVPQALQNQRIEVIMMPAEPEYRPLVEEESTAYATSHKPTLSDDLQTVINSTKKEDQSLRETLVASFLAFKGEGDLSNFGDLVEWQREQRTDSDLPLLPTTA